MQQVSMFYSIETMTNPEWFSMLANTKPQQVEEEDSEESVETQIYELQTDQQFIFNSSLQEPGLYYMRTSKDNASQIPSECRVRKLSFTEIVFLSDFFSAGVTSLIPDDQKMKELAEKGEGFQYFNKEMGSISSEGLELMRDRTWKKYFDRDLGLMALVRRFFSALANLFIKYNYFVDTGIYWPGNSCNYADKVVDQINRIKRVFIRQAYDASKEILSERLGVPQEELEQMDFEELKKTYRRKALQLHPDKNKDPNANDQFSKVNRAWGDFDQLTKLKDELNVDKYEETDLYDEEEEVSTKSSPAAFSFTKHQFKPYLALPAPIAVTA